MPKSKFDAEQNTLEVDTEGYPELEGLQEGQEISGSWTGTVTSVGEDGKVTIEYEGMEFKTENEADKELKSLKGNKNLKTNEDEENDF